MGNLTKRNQLNPKTMYKHNIRIAESMAFIRDEDRVVIFILFSLFKKEERIDNYLGRNPTNILLYNFVDSTTIYAGIVQINGLDDLIVIT